MQKLVTGTLMKALDEATTQKFGMPPVVLMEQAAIAFTDKFRELYPQAKHILVICGCGNNGGDGIAIARLLNQRGVSATVCIPEMKSRCSELFTLQWSIYTGYGYPVTEQPLERAWDGIVDAMFGTGLSRAMGEPYATLTDQLNRLPVPRIAVDIASGLSADDGQIPGAVFHADDTITFSFGKIGSYVYPGAGVSGRVHVVPIGITWESAPEKAEALCAFTKEDHNLFPRRVPDSHKGTYGKLLIIAGSYKMAGAAVLSGMAAYQCGCGLVKVMTAADNREIILHHLPEAILSLYGKTLDPEEVRKDLEWASAVVIGPGLGTDPLAEELLELVIKYCKKPLLMDADALNMMSGQMKPGCCAVVTPHLGEMSRLTGKPIGQIKGSEISCAREFSSQYHCVTVLKGSRTITAVPKESGQIGMYINLSGNSGMSTAGSGDVLSGIIGGLMAQGRLPELAAPLGVYIHGLAGDAAAEAVGMISMTASDIAQSLSRVLHDI